MAVTGNQGTDVTADWQWEGNVADAVARYLRREGWTIVSQADTRSKARGIDVHAHDGRCELLVEAKGYPSTRYRDPLRAGETKRTNPSVQAQHWYAQGLLKTMRLRTQYPDANIAIALPDFPRYRRLFEETRESIEKVGIAVLFVDERGGVDAIGLGR